MAPHSSTCAWKIPWMEEPSGLQSMGSLESDTTERLHFHFSLSCIGEGNGNPLQCSCLESPRDGGAWWAAVYEVAQSQTRLKRLSSSSSIMLVWVYMYKFSCGYVFNSLYYEPRNGIAESYGEIWQNVVNWRREWQTTSVFLPWEHHEQYEKAKWYNTERETPQVRRCPICYWRSVQK